MVINFPGSLKNFRSEKSIVHGSVTDFRTVHTDLSVDEVVKSEDLHNLFLDFDQCDMRKINKIIVHCSATSLGVTPKEIRDYHVNILGWSDCGYHYIITPDGELHNMRPISYVGAHCKGHNFDSVGICLIGGKDEFDFTWKQLRSLSSIVFDLIMTNDLSYDDVYSHHDFNPGKACPRFNARLVLKNIHHYGTF